MPFPGVFDLEWTSLLQQPGPKKFKLYKIELIYKAKKFKVPLFAIYGTLSLGMVGGMWGSEFWVEDLQLRFGSFRK